jgi:hypothetical protein
MADQLALPLDTTRRTSAASGEGARCNGCSKPTSPSSSPGWAGPAVYQSGMQSSLFRSFSGKAFDLCPYCSQKRTLLFGEFVNEALFFNLPHR